MKYLKFQDYIVFFPLLPNKHDTWFKVVEMIIVEKKRLKKQTYFFNKINFKLE